MNILDEIAAYTKERVAERKRICPDPMMAAGGEPVLRRKDIPGGKDTREAFSFEKALRKGGVSETALSKSNANDKALPGSGVSETALSRSGNSDHTLLKSGVSVIAEVKKASPSKGVIAEEFPYVDIARDYDNAGADAISCLTEPHWFLGKNEYLTEIRRATDIPILRKDFTVDPYMIYEAKAIGADAVLLICAILDPAELKDYHALATKLGLSAVVEAHDAREIEMAVKAGARIIGVNNRNLKNFTVNVHNAGRLRDLVPEGTVFISESGTKTRADVLAAEEMRADAVLVGESLMRARNKGRKLLSLRGESPRVKICGLMRESDCEKVNDLHPDYAGFVFANTRHRVDRATAARLRNALDPSIQTVGVFVNEDPETVISLLNDGIIDLAQLHGDETEDEIRKIEQATGKRVIKAVVMKNQSSAGKEAEYPSADYMLYDAGRGSGRTFNWEYLAETPAKPFFLAGGLTPDNVAEAVQTVHPFAVDVSSGVEDADCSKNYEKMKAFIKEVRSISG